MQEFKTIKVDIDKRIKYIQLNNPKQYNKLSQLFFDEFEIEIEKSFEENLACIIIYGHDNVFSSGGDLKEIASSDYSQAEFMCRRVQSIFGKIQNIPVPVIACLKGLVYGGGFELALHCDIRFAGNSTKIKMPEADMGLIPGAGGISLLSKYLTPSDTAYYLFTGEEIPLEKLLQSGLIQKIIPDNQVMNYTINFTERLSLKPIETLKKIKYILYNNLYNGLNEGLESEIKEFSSIVQICGKKKIEQYFNNKKTGNAE